MRHSLLFWVLSFLPMTGFYVPVGILSGDVAANKLKTTLKVPPVFLAADVLSGMVFLIFVMNKNVLV